MKKKILNLEYSSSLTDITELNSSFDTGVLRVCYSGVNRNKSSISKEVLEKCAPTIKNVPIVCNYNREENTIGGHDVEVYTDDDGNVKLSNVTQPVGVVPESSNTFFEEVEEDDGTIHEYLCTEVLLWKRQDAYDYIKENGIVNHSMEIAVKRGEKENGVYAIKDFEFEALCLLGEDVEPCFESSSLQVFSLGNVKDEISKMMNELKESFSITTPTGDDNTPTNNKEFSEEGGEKVLEDNENMKDRNENFEENEEQETVDVNDQADESCDECSIEAPEETECESCEQHEEESKEQSCEESQESFELNNNICEQIQEAFRCRKIKDEWGYECNEFWFVDYDAEKSEAYGISSTNGMLFGFPFTKDGDAVSVDFECKNRKKWAIVDFEDGNDHEANQLSAMFSDITARIESDNNSIKELLEYKESIESKENDARREELFEMFEDLNGVEEFEALKENKELDIQTLEEKCYAIKGRRMTSNAKFSFENNKTVKIKVDQPHETKDEYVPYGGIVEKYCGR